MSGTEPGHDELVDLVRQALVDGEVEFTQRGDVFDVVLPGHGEAFRDRKKIDYFQDYLRDLSKKIAKMHADGVSAEEAAKRIDMTNHAAHFPSITGPGVHPHAVERAYAKAKEINPNPGGIRTAEERAILFGQTAASVQSSTR